MVIWGDVARPEHEGRTVRKADGEPHYRCGGGWGGGDRVGHLVERWHWQACDGVVVQYRQTSAEIGVVPVSPRVASDGWELGAILAAVARLGSRPMRLREYDDGWRLRGE
jgi:hypothetical protein